LSSKRELDWIRRSFVVVLTYTRAELMLTKIHYLHNY